MLCQIVHFTKFVVQHVKNLSYFPVSVVVWVIMVRRVVVFKTKESKNVEEAIACHYVGIKWNRVLLLSGPITFETMTLVMYHLNYKSKILYISSIIITDCCAAVFPVGLNDTY
jgi:hypothetical protein